MKVPVEELDGLKTVATRLAILAHALIFFTR